MTLRGALVVVSLVGCGPPTPAAVPRVPVPDLAPAPDATPPDAAPAPDAMPDAGPTITCVTSRIEVGGPPLGYLAVGTLCLGVREGVWRFAYLDDTPLRSGAYAAGLETGTWRSWYRDGGLLSEGDYASGHPVGPWTWWHPNGTRSAEGAFADGLRDGAWRAWHDTGKPSEERAYVRGKRDGTVLRWDRDGRLQHVGERALHQAGRIRILGGDLLADGAVRGIATAASALGVAIRVLYLSNAEQWKYTPVYRDNILALPFDPKSVVLRVLFGSRWGDKLGPYVYIVQAGADFHRRLGRLDQTRVSTMMDDRTAVKTGVFTIGL